MDLGQMPWGPFDALGKRLDLLLPTDPQSRGQAGPSESEVERALRHVEHAADRCREFAQLTNGNQELWVRSHETWEWIRAYLTALWIEQDVNGLRGGEEGEAPEPVSIQPGSRPEDEDPPTVPDLPHLPGAAATLQVAARALRATPLAVWRERVDSLDSEAPTREEAVQTLLGVARVLSSGTGAEQAPPTPQPEADSPPDPSESDPAPSEDTDPDQVSFDFAQGYDEGYQMGRRVGLALGARNGARPKNR
jgi:hypothetical protein